ncbi:protein IQ-DOMAIN 1 isoform X2 [Carica papaya]|uniref:protein IQ-DOMAIN 1 isoform X2 n=1 Tax=Carica papaya TaxID=3649 RepID=UPI000B8D100A|nr:protein IQ-DOMAIN 1 isoform X2 [Carica papaya]
MGITGELFKGVFSRNRSVGSHEINSERSNLVEKRRWSSVRSYLCGDEFNSVLAEEDSASIKSSEATVTQPAPEELVEEGNILREETNDYKKDEQPKSISKLFREDDAAIIIQSAFRDFLARRRVSINEIPTKDEEQEALAGTESLGRESLDTSIEAQAGNSVKTFSIPEESITAHNWLQQKSRAHILKIKKDWDDSTVSSNISKMRIRSRLEATTRRERALAYAFSQQLRICSKKRQTRNESEPNMGWSWLERWMATRIPDNSSVENSINNQIEPIKSDARYLVRKRLSDVAGEEKESCGSNEVSVQFDSMSITASNEKYGCRLANNRLKAPRNISRRKTVPSYQLRKESIVKASKKDLTRETGKVKNFKRTKLGDKRETKCRDDAT